MTVATGPQNPIRRQARTEPVATEPGIKKRQPHGIAKADDASVGEPQAAAVAPSETDATPDSVDGVDFGDKVFADVVPGPPVPNTQPPTAESKKAVAREAALRRKAVEKGLRDRAASDRIFSGENAKRSPKEKADLLTARHTQYTQLMALNCIKPLAQGIDASSLTEAVSTAAVMWALSPRFRELMADYNTRLNDALRLTRTKMFGENKQVPLGSSPSVVEQAQRKAEREDKAMLDQVSAVLRGTEAVPFSTEAAARTLLQIHEDAYVAIREGEDEAGVRSDLRETVDELRKVWVGQKLDPQLITATARTLAGHTEGSDDLRLAQFIETADGSIRPSPQMLAVGADGIGRPSWGGQWSLATGGFLDGTKSQFFTVRGVSDALEHQDSLSRLVFQDLELAAKSGPGELRKAVIGHLAAWELRDVKLDVGEIGGASRDRAIACVQRRRVADAAMADDGIQEQVRQTVATNALMKAMTEFETTHPDAVAGMVKKFGENHGEAVAEMVAIGKERGKYAPVRPLVFNPSNPSHAEQMAKYNSVIPAPEPARDLDVQPPRPTPLAEWGPRAHQDVVSAQQEQHETTRSVSGIPRITKTEIETRKDRESGRHNESAPNSRPPAEAERVQPQQGLRRESTNVLSGQEMSAPSTVTVGQRHRAQVTPSGYSRPGKGHAARPVPGSGEIQPGGAGPRQTLPPHEKVRRQVEGNPPKKEVGDVGPDLGM